MKRSFLSFSLALFSVMTTGCHKQDSQQADVNSTNTDARSDLSAQPSPMGPGDSAGGTPVTSNPNSNRSSPDSTLNTQQGAAVVGGVNMNPASPSNVPTSVDNQRANEAATNAAVDSANCLDATANDYKGKTVPKNNTCPPTAKSRLKDEDTAKDVSR